MRRIESKIDIASEEFRLNRAHNRGLADTLKERQQRRPPRAAGARYRTPVAAEQDVRARPHRIVARSRHAVSRIVDARRQYRIWRRSPRRRHCQRHRHRQWPRNHHPCRRRQRERRRLVSAVGEEDRPHPRYRHREPAAGRASVRQRRRFPAAASRHLRRPVSGRTHFPQSIDPLQTGRAADRHRARSLHRRRRLRAGAERI